MKTIIKLSFTIALLFAVCISNAKPPEKISVKGKDIITESGKVIRLKGVSFSDPDKLEKNKQWNKQ